VRLFTWSFASYRTGGSGRIHHCRDAVVTESRPAASNPAEVRLSSWVQRWIADPSGGAARDQRKLMLAPDHPCPPTLINSVLPELKQDQQVIEAVEIPEHLSAILSAPS